MRREIKNKEGMIYQGKKEGEDFILCPWDKKSKCMNFIAEPPKYPSAWDMYNDENEKWCKQCKKLPQLTMNNRTKNSRERQEKVHEKNRRRANSEKGVRVGNQMIPYKPRRIA